MCIGLDLFLPTSLALDQIIDVLDLLRGHSSDVEHPSLVFAENLAFDAAQKFIQTVAILVPERNGKAEQLSVVSCKA